MNAPVVAWPDKLYATFKRAGIRQVGYVPVGNFIGKAEARFFSLKDNIAPWQIWNWPANLRLDRMFQSVYQTYTTTPAR